VTPSVSSQGHWPDRRGEFSGWSSQIRERVHSQLFNYCILFLGYRIVLRVQRDTGENDWRSHFV